jgi:hypothetical protein
MWEARRLVGRGRWRGWREKAAEGAKPVNLSMGRPAQNLGFYRFSITGPALSAP